MSTSLASLDWSASSESAQLNFRDEEEAYVPNFVKVRAAKGRRKKPFPSDDGEFHVATVDAFAGDGHSVLVYCPVRSQTEFGQIHLEGSEAGVSGTRPSTGSG